MTDCRVERDTNEYYDEIERIDFDLENYINEGMERAYKDANVIQESLSMDIMDFEGTRNEEADYWKELMLEIGDAHKNKDMQKIGMLLYPHMKAYIDYISD